MKPNMPYIQSAFSNWESLITLIVVTQANNDDGNTVSTEYPISFVGTIQPLKPTELEVNSYGQRRWEWYQIHTRYELGMVLQPNDLIKYNGINYKIMLQNNYSLNGYFEYHLIEDYQNG